jgi:hypothetical protein
MTKLISLEDVLAKDVKELTELKQGTFDVEKLGTVAFTAIDHNEYKQIKRDCTKNVPDKTGGYMPEVDDDKMMIKVIITAVDKDKRTTFTFLNKDLLQKLDVVSAESAVVKLLEPGEVLNMAIAIQGLSGFGAKAEKEQAEEIKN